MWTNLILGATFGFAAAVQPGPFQTYLVGETVSRGWRRTVPAAFAPLCSDIPVIAAALFVLSRIPDGLVRFLHLGGACFLFYLSVHAFRTWRRYDPERPQARATERSTFLRAVVVNLLNPNPWLGWSLVLGPLFRAGYAESPSQGFALIVGFYATMVCCLLGLVALLASARRLGARFNKALLGLSVAGLAGFGLYQLWLGLGGTAAGG
jgi:threonine/homoserine/homoserine lactone efflux protein